MSDIFVSYCSKDRAVAGRVAEALAREGWSVWWDRNIRPGDSFDHAIEEVLQTARCVVVLWSRESAASEWVKTEAAEGARRRILVPVLIEEGVKIPLEFRRIQAADLSSWVGDRSPEFELLATAVRHRIVGSQTSSAPPAPSRRRCPPDVPAPCSAPRPSS